MVYDTARMYAPAQYLSAGVRDIKVRGKGTGGAGGAAGLDGIAAVIGDPILISDGMPE